MSDAAAGNGENVMVQASFHTPSKTLINAKGHDDYSFKMALAIVHDNTPTILATEQALAAGGNVAAAMPLAQEQPAQSAPPNNGWDTPAQSFGDAATPTCAHGQRNARSGNGKRGPWKAWFCGSPQGTPDQCKPIFLDRGTPEWDSFPA